MNSLVVIIEVPSSSYKLSKLAAETVGCMPQLHIRMKHE